MQGKRVESLQEAAVEGSVQYALSRVLYGPGKHSRALWKDARQDVEAPPAAKAASGASGGPPERPYFLSVTGGPTSSVTGGTVLR